MSAQNFFGRKFEFNLNFRHPYGGSGGGSCVLSIWVIFPLCTPGWRPLSIPGYAKLVPCFLLPKHPIPRLVLISAYGLDHNPHNPGLYEQFFQKIFLGKNFSHFAFFTISGEPGLWLSSQPRLLWTTQAFSRFQQPGLWAAADSTFASSLLMRWFFASRVSIITRLVVAIVEFFRTIFALPPLHSITTRVITVLKMFGLCQ